MVQLIIVPSRAVATKYRQWYAKHSPNQIPTIYTWPDLLRELSAEAGEDQKQLLSPLEIYLLTRQSCLDCRDDLKHYQPIASTGGFWRALSRYLQDVRSSGEKLQAARLQPEQVDDLELIKDRFESLLSATKGTDLPGRYQVLTQAAGKVSLDFSEILVISPGKLPAVQEELLEAIAGGGIPYSVVSTVLPQQPPAKLHLITASEPYGEVHQIVLDIAKLLQQGAALADIAVIYPDERYLSILRKELEPYQIPVRSSMAMPITSVPLVGRVIDAFVRTRGTASATFSDQLLSVAREVTADSSWLQEIGAGEEDSRVLAARELRALDQLLELAEEAGRSLELVFNSDSVDKSEFLHALQFLLEEETIWVQNYPGPGLPCYLLSQAAGVSARHQFYLGLSQALLGQRREGWLPAPGHRIEPAAVLDALLCEGPDSAALCCPRTNLGGGLNLTPLYFTGAARKWNAEELSLPHYLPGKKCPDARNTLVQDRLAIEDYRLSQDFTRWDGNLASIADQLFSPQNTFAVSGLETYRRCPFSFYAQKLLGLEVEDEDIREVQVLDEGSLIHQVLYSFFLRVKLPLHLDYPDYIGQLHDLLSKAIAAKRATLPDIPPGAWEVARMRIMHFLTQVLDLELSEFKKGNQFRPAFLEERIEPLEISAAPGRVRLVGRIDRVDSDDSGNWLLIDYKGGTVSKKEIEECHRLQLPIYAEAWRRRLLEQGKPAKALGACYLSYRQGRRTTFFPKDQDQWRETALQAAKEAVEGMLSGCFIPLPNSKQTCDSCGFDSLCRAPGGGFIYKNLAVGGEDRG